MRQTRWRRTKNFRVVTCPAPNRYSALSSACWRRTCLALRHSAKRNASEARQARQRSAIDDVDPLPGQIHPTLILEYPQQPAHDLAHAAQLIGERLMRRVHRIAFGQ